MRIQTAIITIGSLVLLAGSADATPNKIGAIGDSISAAMDADDDCDTLFECAGQLGEDRGYSWTTGASLSNSMRKKLGFYYTVEKQKNGSRWQDAPGQAQAILDAGGAVTVTIELGGNDVCRNLNDTLPTKASIKSYIHTTLTKLINAPSTKRPSTIIIGEAPDVVHLRNTMRTKDNFAFETCQDLWDLNTSRLEVNTCDWGFFDFLCDIADFIIEATADFVSPLINVMKSAFNIKFPCGYVLSSSSNSTKRALAQALNNDINAAIAEEIAEHQGQNGVTLRLASNLQEYQFTSGDVSQLDCFHPNRRGQKNVAQVIYNGAYNNAAGGTSASTSGTSYDTGAPYMLSYPTSQAWWVGSGTYRDIYNVFYTNENAEIEIWSYLCGYGNWYYEGTTNETPTGHEFHVDGFNFNYYWAMYVRPTDTSGNTGIWYNTGCI